MDPADRTELLETLRDAQRLGFFGAAPIEEAVARAERFIPALTPLAAGARLVDIGSGGGLPGLVIAAALPAASVLLVDRRQKRTDFLERAVKRLGMKHVAVACTDVRDLVRAVRSGSVTPFDRVTARGFGPPEVTLTLASGLMEAAGRVVISEPPAGERWPDELLERLELEVEYRPGVSVFRRHAG